MKQPQKPKSKRTNEEIVARILGLPLERIQCLKEEHEMPVAEPEFSKWFVEHPQIILDELKRQDKIKVANFTHLQKEISAKNDKNGGFHQSGVSVPAAYGS